VTHFAFYAQFFRLLHEQTLSQIAEHDQGRRYDHVSWRIQQNHDWHEASEDGAMDDKKSTRFSLDELARQLVESVPQNLKVLGQDLERNFKTLLQSGLERMELVTREEFDLQRAVLDRTRAKLEQMESRLGELEKALSGK